MKSVTVRELKNKTSEILRRAAREDVIITSRGRPVACLVGVTEEDVVVPLLLARREARLTEREKEKMFAIAARLWKIKPEKGKKWISQEHHDRILYGGPSP